MNSAISGKSGAPVGRQATQSGMVPIAETDAVGFLDQLDPVEDSTPNVGGPFEGITAGTGDDERLLAWLQPAGQPAVALVAQQAAADGRHRDVRDIEIDEAVVRSAFLRARCGDRIARFLEGLVDIGDGEG
ncbi:hypothetical protein ABIF41_007340 [Bradyrhizobium japonicum]